MIVLQCLAALYGLSWLILLSAVILMLCRPNPSNGMLEAILVTIMAAFWYIAAYFVIRGIVRAIRRACGDDQPAGPMPQEAVVIRRMILEEVTPMGSGQPAYRVVHEEVTPTNERHWHAR